MWSASRVVRVECVQLGPKLFSPMSSPTLCQTVGFWHFIGIAVKDTEVMKLPTMGRYLGLLCWVPT